jgi:hypothetical protein
MSRNTLVILATYFSIATSTLWAGEFQQERDYIVGSAPFAITAGDFNNDGRMDLATANEIGNTVSILLGNGDGTFQRWVDYSLGSGNSPQAIATGDFNGDHALDIVTANTDGVSVLLGNGDGTFQPSVNYPGGYENTGVRGSCGFW